MKTKATALVRYISPTICLPGEASFIQVVALAAERLANGKDMNVLRTICAEAAPELGMQLQAVTKAVQRAVDAIWMDGKNDRLHEIAGRILPTVTAKELVLYCAHYLITGEPYHKKPTILVIE